MSITRKNHFGALILTGLVLTTVLISGMPSKAIAQYPPQSGDDSYRGHRGFSGKTVVLPIGTTFEGRIQSTIGSSQSKQGERFAIEISAPIMANGTEVLIPSGSQVMGEVVEAVSSSRQPKEPGMRIHPLGKLRVQLMSLQLPTGLSYPMVGSLCGEVNPSRGGHYSGMTVSRRSGVAYVGSQSGFDAVNPSIQKRGQMRDGKLAVLRRDELMRDPILGEDITNGVQDQYKQVRSLVKRGRDLYIYSGSAMTIRLDAPLKIAFGASAGRASIDAAPEAPFDSKAGFGKHFNPQKEDSSQNNAPQDATTTQASGEPPAKTVGTTPATPNPATPVKTNQGGSGVQNPGSDF